MRIHSEQGVQDFPRQQSVNPPECVGLEDSIFDEDIGDEQVKTEEKWWKKICWQHDLAFLWEYELFDACENRLK